MVEFLLVLLILISGYFGIFLFANRTPPATPNSNGPKGVSGWLLLLVVQLMLMGPLIGYGNIITLFEDTELLHPNLLTDPVWSHFKSSVTWISLAVFFFSFYAGFGLATGRDISVVNRAKILLWVTGPVSEIVMYIFVSFAYPAIPIVFYTFSKDLLFSVISASIWTAYLSYSRRVKATYIITIG